MFLGKRPVLAIHQQSTHAQRSGLLVACITQLKPNMVLIPWSKDHNNIISIYIYISIHTIPRWRTSNGIALTSTDGRLHRGEAVANSDALRRNKGRRRHVKWDCCQFSAFHRLSGFKKDLRVPILTQIPAPDKCLGEGWRRNWNLCNYVWQACVLKHGFRITFLLPRSLWEVSALHTPQPQWVRPPLRRGQGEGWTRRRPWVRPLDWTSTIGRHRDKRLGLVWCCWKRVAEAWLPWSSFTGAPPTTRERNASAARRTQTCPAEQGWSRADGKG